MIELKKVSKSYQDKLVLDNVDLLIPHGCVFGLIGPNGSGKSTLLRLLSGALKSDEGEVLIDEEAVYNQAMVKNKVLLLSDDPYYFAQGSLAKMKQFYQNFYPSFDESIYRRYMNIFQLNEHELIRNYSKGMKRQAFICIALAISPKYLLLDEAFDGLDPVMRLTFKKAIATMIEEKDMSVIISSHNLRELEDICDYYGIIDQNKVITSGAISDAKDKMHHYQLAFNQEVQGDWFKALEVLSLDIHSKVCNVVIKGDYQEVDKYIDSLKPVMKETLNVSLEQLFIYELKSRGYGVYEN